MNMALQSTTFGSQSRKFNALINMQQTLDLAEERVQQSTEKTFNKMQEALNQSEANNKTLQERITQLTRENSSLKQQLKEVKKNNEAFKKAFKASLRAEQERNQERINDIAQNIKTLCKKISKFAQDIKQQRTGTHNANQPLFAAAQYEAQSYNGYISDMDKFEIFAKTIEQLTSKLEQAEEQ
jgi:chromosome segregation ATPase